MCADIEINVQPLPQPRDSLDDGTIEDQHNLLAAKTIRVCVHIVVS